MPSTYVPMSTLIQLPHPDLELILLESQFNSHLYTIGGFYRPPNSGSDYMSKLHRAIALLRPQNFPTLLSVAISISTSQPLLLDFSSH